MAIISAVPQEIAHDWRLWFVVGLMLAAMVAYVLSDNGAFGLGGHMEARPPAPATNP